MQDMSNCWCCLLRRSLGFDALKRPWIQNFCYQVTRRFAVINDAAKFTVQVSDLGSSFVAIFHKSKFYSICFLFSLQKCLMSLTIMIYCHYIYFWIAIHLNVGPPNNFSSDNLAYRKNFMAMKDRNWPQYPSDIRNRSKHHAACG